MTKKFNFLPLKILICIVLSVILLAFLLSEFKGMGLPSGINYKNDFGVGSIIFMCIATLLPFVLLGIWVIRKYGKSKTTYIVLGLFALSYIIRILVSDFISGDYYWCLADWVEIYRTMPIKDCFVKQVGNYPPVYNYFLIIFSRIPISDLYLIKTLSFYFEVATAIVVMRLIADVRREESNPIDLAITLLLVIPLFNSSQWAQCDTMYTFFVVLGIYFAIHHRSIQCFVMMGLGLAMKMQTLLIYPVVLILLICKNTRGERYLYWKHIWYTPVAFIGISTVPLLFGGSIFKVIDVYIDQIFVGNYGQALVGNCANVFLMLGGIEKTDIMYPIFSFIFIGIVAIILAFIITRVYKTRKNSLEIEDIILLSTFMPMISVFFMPKMLDRFYYIAEIFMFIYMMVSRDRVFTRRVFLSLEYGVLITYCRALGLTYSYAIYCTANIFTGVAVTLMVTHFLKVFKKEEPLIG